MRSFFYSIILLGGMSQGVNAQLIPEAKVKMFEGVPTLFVNGDPYPPYAYKSYLGEVEYYSEIAASGIHLYSFPAYLGDRGINTMSGIGPFRSPIWLGDKHYDFEPLVQDLDKILQADPGALVIIRLHLDPPKWWEAKYPQYACHLPDSSTFRQCFFSTEWREQTSLVVSDLINWLEHSKYRQHVIGFHVAAGGTEEWVYHYNQEFFDENPIRTEAFERWLKAEYPDRRYSGDLAVPADISGQRIENRWLDPVKDRHVIDTYRFHAWTLADNIAYFCKVVKMASKGRLLTGAFYGYHYFITDPRKGHGALATLLDCQDLDYLSSPNDYRRVAGEDWPAMAAIQSVQMHGKLWLTENDTRTSVTTLLKDRAPAINPPGGYYDAGVWLGPPDMETSVSFLKKNLGRMLSEGYGGWWFDMWGGWFSDPQFLAVFEKGQSLFLEYPSVAEPLMAAQVAVLVDEELCFLDASLGKKSGEIMQNRYALGKTGAPYDLFLRSDLDRLLLDRYKVVWLLGIPDLGKKEKDFVRSCQERGIHVLWTDLRKTLYSRPLHDAVVYDGRMLWKEEELREIWEKAGVHCYAAAGDVLNAGRRWLILHTDKGGDKQIRLPFPAAVVDVFTGATWDVVSEAITLHMPLHSTRILRIMPK